jgi:GntR family transcriptional regulator
LDATANEPRESLLYLQVSDHIANAIEKGQLQPGSRLSSERDLAQQLGLSRVTVRRGLQELARSGLIEAAAGHAWFVKPKVIEGPTNALQGFTETAHERGLGATSTILSAGLRAATLDEAEVFRVAPGAELVELLRLRLLDGIPTAVDYSLVPHAHAPGLLEVDFVHASLFSVLAERYGCAPTRADYAVEAAAADPDIARALGVTPGAPVLVTVGTTFDAEGRPIHFGRTTYRADRYRFHASRTLPGAARSVATTRLLPE